MFRRLFRSSPPLITSEHALAIAQRECASRGWTWREPVTIAASRGAWHITTNAMTRGVNARFVIDHTSGTVKQAAYLPR